MNRNTLQRKHESFAVWMDYQNAVIYRFGEDPVFLKQIDSGISGLAKTTGGKASFDPHFSRSISGHKRIDEHRRQKLRIFFNDVVDVLPIGSDVFLFGPGLAKSNFKNFLEEHCMHRCRCAGVFSKDYMSDAEVVAYLKSLYHLCEQMSEVQKMDTRHVDAMNSDN